MLINSSECFLTHNQVVAGSSPAVQTTTAKGGLIADNQYGKIQSSSPAGPTENQALTLKSVGAFGFIYVHTIAYR